MKPLQYSLQNSLCYSDKPACACTFLREDLPRVDLSTNQIEDLVMFVKRLARALEAVSPNNDLSPKAMEYIRQIYVQHCALR